MTLTPRGKREKDRARREAKKETDRTGTTSTMPNRPLQGELSSPAVSADHINELPGTSPRLILQEKENTNPNASTPNGRGRPTKNATPFNTSLSGPLSSINLNSSAGLKRSAVPQPGPPSKFGRSGGQLSIAALSGDEMEVDSDASVASTVSKRGGRPRKKQPPRVNGRFSRDSSVLSRDSSIASVSSNDSIITTDSTSSRREAPKSQAERAAVIIAEHESEERQAEKVAARLNDEQFKAPALPPPRRSVRSTKGQAPKRFADEIEDPRRRSSVNEITNNCRHQQHKGYGCAALKAKHLPDYFDSMEDATICPHCQSMNMAHNSDSVKCCLKGRVELAEHLKKIQQQPPEYLTLKDGRFGEPKHQNFLKWSSYYNSEMAFGTLVHDQENVPHGMQVAKINGAIKYRVSGPHHPFQHSDQPHNFTRKWGQCYTITPEDAIPERLANYDPKGRLNDSIIAFLHKMLAKHHTLAKVYKHCANYYEEKLRECVNSGEQMPRFQIQLLKKRTAIEEGAGDLTEGIHSHRLLLPTELGMTQCATVHFDEDGDNAPPKERGMTLHGRDGSFVDFPPYDPNIDAALFPLIFTLGQRTFETGIPMKKDKGKKKQADDSVIIEEIPDEEDDPEAAIENNTEDNNEDHSEEDEDGEKTDCGPPKRWKKKKGPHEFVSMRKFYRYMLQTRESWKGAYHWLWWSLWLAQIFVITVYNRIEANEAEAIRQANQNLSIILPAVLIKAIENKIKRGKHGFGNNAKLGKVFFAPPTFRGSRRYYQKAYADAQAICRAFGNPHIFLTFTLNSEAKEFKECIEDGQTWADRPDRVADLFVSKHKELMNDIVKKEIFGPVAAWYSTVEHQKRGLPHLHMCITLKTPHNNYFNEENWNPMTLTPEEWCHQYICAEIPPEPEKGKSKHLIRQRDYRNDVVHLLHHSCSAQCIVDGKCSKRFPKPFSPVNIVSDESYPVYRRRQPARNDAEKAENPERYGETYTFAPVHGVAKTIDNRHIVAHNPYLVQKYRSHINLEWMQGDATAKYITKYITKGCDLALVKVSEGKDGAAIVNYDEFEEIRLGVYRTASEAMLGIYGHKIFDKSHSVESLFIHEKGKIQVVYEDGEEEPTAERLLRDQLRGKERTSSLTEYFKLNNMDPEANKHTYVTISQDYWWSKKDKKWLKRLRKYQKLVRIGSASAGNRQLQALRLLLMNVKGPKGFDELTKDQNGVECGSYVKAAIARGLLADDKLWDDTIRDAMDEKRSMSERIRWFALFIANTLPQEATKLLTTHFDILTMWPRLNKQQKMEKLLCRIEHTLRIHGIRPSEDDKTACESVGLPRPKNFKTTLNDEIRREYFRDDFMQQHLADDEEDVQDTQPRNSFAAKFQLWHDQCTEAEQRPFVDAVLAAAKANPLDDIQRHFFLTGAGGTGKTFVYNTIIAGMKSQKLRVLPCASTGIAAELLIDGGTVHRRFSVPNDVSKDEPMRIPRHSNYAAVLDAAQLIIIDEISMQDRYVLEFVDRQLRDISPKYSHLPFAGKAIVIGGDWKQLMPVIAGGNSEVQCSRSVKLSRLFRLFETTRLTINKRLASSDERMIQFSRYQAKLATGVTTDDKDRINVPASMTTTDENGIIDFVFPPEAMTYPTIDSNLEKISGSALLCPTNAEALRLNKIILDKISGETRTFYSMDEAMNDDPLQTLAVHAADKCIENLNRQTPSGMPPHELDIKVGAIMMLIKNLSISDGLCNGTRLQIVAIKSENILTCRYITGPRKGNTFDLYKCPFEHGGSARKEGEAAFRWKRIQFPLRPGFVLTINKSQGQTLDRVGLLLQNSQCFSHGQLYVAASRVRDPNSLKILMREGANSVQNVVHQPILDQEEIDKAYKFAEEDGDRQLISATPNTVGTTATTSTDSTPRTSKVSRVSATETTNTTASTSTTTKKPARPALSPRLPGPSSSTGTNKTTSSSRTNQQIATAPANSPANPPTQTAQQHNVEGDGNCLYRSVSYCMERKETLFVGLRKKAVQGLIWIDSNGTEEQKEELLRIIGGVLPGERRELLAKYNNNIKNFAENYTKHNKNWGGIPEVIALAKNLERTIIIINERVQHEGATSCIAYRPDFTKQQHFIRDELYEQLWQREDNPIVVTHNGHTHFQAVYINNA